MKVLTGGALAAMLITTGVLSAGPRGALAATATSPQSATSELTGVWTLDYSDIIHPDGSREHDYGEKPIGLLIIDASGNYSQQIFDTARPKFAAGDKAKGTAEEYRSATIGASSHFGTVTVDEAKHVLTYKVAGSTYPNQEGATQNRFYTLTDGILINKQAPRSNGDVPVTEWRRLR